MTTDTAMNVLETGINQCAAIRRDVVWARGSDAASRHGAVLRDLEAHIPLCDSAIVADIYRGAIHGERAAFAAI